MQRKYWEPKPDLTNPDVHCGTCANSVLFKKNNFVTCKGWPAVEYFESSDGIRMVRITSTCSGESHEYVRSLIEEPEE